MLVQQGGNLWQPQQFLTAVVEHLRHAHPWWNRTGGADHVFFTTQDKGGCWVPPALHASIVVSYFGYTEPMVFFGHEQRWLAAREGRLRNDWARRRYNLSLPRCFVPTKDVVVPVDFTVASPPSPHPPPMQAAQPTQQQQQQQQQHLAKPTPRPASEASCDATSGHGAAAGTSGARPTLLFMSGSVSNVLPEYSQGVRQEFYRLHRHTPGVRFRRGARHATTNPLSTPRPIDSQRAFSSTKKRRPRAHPAPPTTTSSLSRRRPRQANGASTTCASRPSASRLRDGAMAGGRTSQWPLGASPSSSSRMPPFGAKRRRENHRPAASKPADRPGLQPTHARASAACRACARFARRPAVHRLVQQAYEELLPYANFSLRFAPEQLRDLPALLRALPPQRVCALRAGLAKYAAAVMWQPPHGRAYDFLMASLCRRALALFRRNQPPGAPPPSWAPCAALKAEQLM